jgi:hypothetical protein
VEHAAGFTRGVVDSGGFAGGQVNGGDLAAQADGVRAHASGRDLPLECAEVLDHQGVSHETSSTVNRSG